MVSVQFHEKFTGPSVCGEWAKNFKLLSDISFAHVSSYLYLKSFAWIEIVQYPQNYKHHKVDQDHSKKLFIEFYKLHVNGKH